MEQVLWSIFCNLKVWKIWVFSFTQVQRPEDQEKRGWSLSPSPSRRRPMLTPKGSQEAKGANSCFLPLCSIQSLNKLGDAWLLWGELSACRSENQRVASSRHSPKNWHLLSWASWFLQLNGTAIIVWFHEGLWHISSFVEFSKPEARAFCHQLSIPLSHCVSTTMDHNGQGYKSPSTTDSGSLMAEVGWGDPPELCHTSTVVSMFFLISNEYSPARTCQLDSSPEYERLQTGMVVTQCLQPTGQTTAQSHKC